MIVERDDVVVLRDYSYHLVVKRFRSPEAEVYAGGEIGKGDKYRVIAIGCSLPAGAPTSKQICSIRANDTIVKALDGGRIVFTCNRFLEKVPQCPHCHKFLE